MEISQRDNKLASQDTIDSSNSEQVSNYWKLPPRKSMLTPETIEARILCYAIRCLNSFQI